MDHHCRDKNDKCSSFRSEKMRGEIGAAIEMTGECDRGKKGRSLLEPANHLLQILKMKINTENIWATVWGRNFPREGFEEVVEIKTIFMNIS